MWLRFALETCVLREEQEPFLLFIQIRQAKGEPEEEARLAMVAVQLDLRDEAKSLYETCKRYDLLNKTLQAEGNWEQAIQIAEKYDRINLKNTYYRAAKEFEIERNFSKAIEYFEKSGTHLTEIPRMLLCNSEIDLLYKYIDSKRDKSLYKWKAEHLESQGAFEEAEKMYKLAEDTASLVRLLVFQGEMKRAREICQQTNDPAACFYLAKQFEISESFPEAIQFYVKAQYYGQAAKLARDNGMDNEVLSLSLMSPKPVMLHSAAFFEGKGLIEKAVILYMKGRAYAKAMEVAQKANLFDYVKRIKAEMAEEREDDLEESRNDGSISSLLTNKQFDKVLELCASSNVLLSEELANRISEGCNSEMRNEFLIKIAKVAKKQGNFDLASRKFIEGGDKIKAVKALIRLGNAEKVITFASNARHPQIYVFAANFLQQTDWHSNPETTKSIINFYGRAKAWEHLAGFFENCANMEIDEYRDYNKAFGALQEAMKHANKAQVPDRIQLIQQKLFLIEKFLNAKSVTDSNPMEMLKSCEQLLDAPNIDDAVRIGDIFAHLVEFFYKHNDFKQSFECLKSMEKKNIILTHFIDQEIVQEIYKANGQTYSGKSGFGEEEEGTFKEEFFE